jgi:hypothetical protein
MKLGYMKVTRYPLPHIVRRDVERGAAATEGRIP